MLVFEIIWEVLSSQTQNVQNRNQGKLNFFSVSIENTNSKGSNKLLTIFNQAAIIVLLFTDLTYSYTALFKFGY